MALSRFVVTARTVITADTLATMVAGEPGTGGAAGFGNAGTAPAAGHFGLFPGQQFERGQVIYADSSAGTAPAQLLYQAIGAGNLRAWVDGQDAVGHAGLSN